MFVYLGSDEYTLRCISTRSKFSYSTCSVLSATCRAHLFFSTGSSITHWEGWWWTNMVKKRGSRFG